MGVQITRNDGSQFFSDNPKKDLMDKLMEQTSLAGHLLSFDEAGKDPKMIQPNCYAFYFGSFSEAAKKAWDRLAKPSRQVVRPIKPIARPSRPVVKPNDQAAEPSKPTPKSNGEKPSIMTEQATRKRRGSVRSPHYNYDRVKAQMMAFYDQHGRLPMQVEVVSNPELPSWTTLIKFLGPKTDWEEALSLPPKQTGSQGPKRPLGQRVEPSKELPTPESRPGSLSQPDSSLSGNESPQSDTQPIIREITDDKVVIDASKLKKDDIVTIEVKFVFPGRENPIQITLTV